MTTPSNETTGRIGIGIATTRFESIGFAFREQSVSDHGIDAHVELRDGEHATGRLLAVQVKTGPSYLKEMDGDSYVYRSDSGHISYWLGHSLPVIVALVDPVQECVYWAYVSRESVISTGKGNKLLVATSQKVDAASARSLADLVTELVPAEKYTVMRQEDNSHAGAKRYSVEILLSWRLSKAEIAAVVRQATIGQIGSRYYRNSQTRTQFGDADADVVWSFVYLTPQDRERASWVCRSIWISDGLRPENRPGRFEGENIGLGISVEWSETYSQASALTAANTLTKEAYIDWLEDTLKELCPLMDAFEERLAECGSVDSSFLALTAVLRSEIRRVYSDSTGVGIAPFECSQVDVKAQEVMAFADNIILTAESGCDTVRGHLISSQVADYKRTLAELNYELRKIR